MSTEPVVPAGSIARRHPAASSRRKPGRSGRFLRGVAALAVATLAVSSGDAVALDSPVSFVLSDGTQVDVAVNGAFTLSRNGREVFASAPTAAPVVKRFRQDNASALGFWTFQRSAESALQLTELRTVRFDEATGTVELRLRSGKRSDGTKPAREKATLTIAPLRDGEATVLKMDVKQSRNIRRTPVGSIGMPMRCDSGNTFFGFGEQYNAADQKGEAFPLFVSEQGIGRVANPAPGLPTLLNGNSHTTYFPMPYYLDARGFGLLARTDRRAAVDLCKSDPAVAWMEVEDTRPLELVVFHGPTPLDVIRELGDEVGRPQAPPAWAYELWIGAQGGQAAILAEANLLRSENIPAGVLWVQDWTGAKPGPLGGSDLFYRWEAGLDDYPDLPGLIAQVKGLGFHWLGYNNPFVDVTLQHYAPMRDQHLLVTRGGQPQQFLGPNATSALPDLTNPAARTFVKDYLRAMVTDFGMDGWMSDFGEWSQADGVYSDGSDPIVRHNRYPVDWHRLWREVMDEVRPDGDFVVFARSGWTGVQQGAMIYWVGDQQTLWDTDDGIGTVVPALLSLGLSGVPFVTHDIAGYSSYQCATSTKELFQRWTELGAFTPYMRTHEGEHRDANWTWKSDVETTDHFRRFALIHQALAPDFQQLAAAAETTSAPILRHLMLVFPDDAASRAIDDQFMVGDSLLVAPVLEEGAVQRSVYLPPGSTWYDVWTGDAYAGGQTVVRSAPVGFPPVFSRDMDRGDLRAIP